MNAKKKNIPEKKIKSDICNCRYDCSKLITPEGRQSLFNKYYSLGKLEKDAFIASTIQVMDTKRPNKAIENSRRKKTINYFFFVEGEFVKVCKRFYLDTLAISHQKVDYLYKKNLCKVEGPHNRKVNNFISEDLKNDVRDHIRSFPKIESHYCRSSSKKEFVDSRLSIQKMYEMYEQNCEENNKEKVKASMYRSIFVREFNIDFHVPKKDRCDTCEEVKSAEKTESNFNKMY